MRNVPAGISPARAVDLMEATAADACALKQRAGNKRWRIRAKWHTLTFTFYWQPDPPADEPAVIHEAVDVLRAGELQAAIVRGADDDGPCTILLFNTIHPATGLEVMQWRAAPGPVACRRVVPVCSQDHPPHFHVWRIAATGQAAFLSRPSLNRSTAAHPAERWGLSRYRVVQTCGLHNECPRPPRRAHD